MRSITLVVLLIVGGAACSSDGDSAFVPGTTTTTTATTTTTTTTEPDIGDTDGLLEPTGNASDYTQEQVDDFAALMAARLAVSGWPDLDFAGPDVHILGAFLAQGAMYCQIIGTAEFSEDPDVDAARRGVAEALFSDITRRRPGTDVYDRLLEVMSQIWGIEPPLADELIIGAQVSAYAAASIALCPEYTDLMGQIIEEQLLDAP